MAIRCLIGLQLIMSLIVFPYIGKRDIIPFFTWDVFSHARRHNDRFEIFVRHKKSNDDWQRIQYVFPQIKYNNPTLYHLTQKIGYSCSYGTEIPIDFNQKISNLIGENYQYKVVKEHVNFKEYYYQHKTTPLGVECVPVSNKNRPSKNAI